MEKITLEKRTILGKKSKNLLDKGLTPAVIYNAKGESSNIQLDSSVAGKIGRTATSTTIFDASLDGKDIKVLVKELDVNPVTDQLRHISFFGIDESKEMVFTVPFRFVGISTAVKNNLGVLVEVLSAIDVKCKLADLKSDIEVDISGMDHPGQTITIKDIALPNGMSLINKDQEQATIVTVTELQKEEEVVVAAPVEGEVAAPAEGEVAETPATEEKAE